MIPMCHLIRSHCHRAATRLATLNNHHPLFHRIRKAINRYPKRHASPLHDILHCSKINLVSIETIDPHPRHPCWKPPFNTEIAPSKEEACVADRNCEADIRIYSDGSGKDGLVGAAAILKFGFRAPRKARFHLGSIKEHMVFEGECIGQLLGLKLLQSSKINLNGRDVSLGIDSQAAITRHNKRTNSSASYIIDEIHKLAGDLITAFPRIRFAVRWTPGHVGLAGNEEVDLEAKKAAEKAFNNINSHFGILRRPLLISRSAHRQTLKRETTDTYQREFRQSPRFQRVSRFDPSMPSNKFRKLTAELPRRFASILTQLRTGHIPLQAYLHKFKLVDSPICQQCEEAPETVTHFIMFCHKFAAERRQLRRSLGRETNLDLSILGNNKHLPALFHFIKSTDRFVDAYGDLNPSSFM